MKTSLSAMLALMILSCTLSCGKGGGSTPSETALAITTNPPNGSTQTPAPGTSFPLTVTITSKMPSKGVTIDVTAQPDGGGTQFFSSSQSSSQAVNNYTITNTPVAKVCVVTVTVTSLSQSSNTATSSYRFSAK